MLLKLIGKVIAENTILSWIFFVIATCIQSFSTLRFIESTWGLTSCQVVYEPRGRNRLFLRFINVSFRTAHNKLNDVTNKCTSDFWYTLNILLEKPGGKLNGFVAWWQIEWSRRLLFDDNINDVNAYYQVKI